MAALYGRPRTTLAGLLRLAEAEDGPDGEGHYQGGAYGEGRGHVLGVAGQEAAGGAQDGRKRVEAGDRLDPTRQQGQRDEDRRQEEDQEDRGPNHGPRLLGAQHHRDAGPEEGRRDVGEDGEGYQAEEVEATGYGHAGHERQHRDEGARHEGPHERGHGIAQDYAVPVRGGEHEPSGEAVLEVARYGEPGERPAHR